jgi:hypothetical protein
MSAGEVMSTWGGKTEAGLLNGALKTSDRLDIGGDFQYISISTKDYERDFFMQRELQVSVNWDRKYTLTVTSGLYGESEESEVRKAYLQVNMFQNWTAKAGKFFPAFGIMSNEHTYLYRARDFNQGQESYNAELMYSSKYFEVVAAKVFGKPDDFVNGVLIGKEGFSGRLSIFPDKAINVGASFYSLIDPKGVFENAAAAHFLWGINKSFWLESQVGLEDTYFRIGLAPTKGFFVKPTVEYDYVSQELTRTEIVFQWLPRPHIDLQLTCSKSTWIALLHYYL